MDKPSRKQAKRLAVLLVAAQILPGCVPAGNDRPEPSASEALQRFAAGSRRSLRPPRGAFRGGHREGRNGADARRRPARHGSVHARRGLGTRRHPPRRPHPPPVQQGNLQRRRGRTRAVLRRPGLRRRRTGRARKVRLGGRLPPVRGGPARWLRRPRVGGDAAVVERSRGHVRLLLPGREPDAAHDPATPRARRRHPARRRGLGRLGGRPLRLLRIFEGGAFGLSASFGWFRGNAASGRVARPLPRRGVCRAPRAAHDRPHATLRASRPRYGLGGDHEHAAGGRVVGPTRLPARRRPLRHARAPRQLVVRPRRQRDAPAVAHDAGHAESDRGGAHQFAILSPTTHCMSERATEHTVVGDIDFGDARLPTGRSTSPGSTTGSRARKTASRRSRRSTTT